MTAQAASRWRATAIFFGTSFFLHLLWENLQAPLYVGYTSFAQHFWICLRATFGDMLFMSILYGILALLHRDLAWIGHKSVLYPFTWIVITLAGFFLAIGFEYWALSVHRWEYDAMPTILGIGIFPVLQMIVIPLATLSISRSVVRE